MNDRAQLVVRCLTRSTILLALFAAIGCGGGVGDVSGTVKHNGQPLDGGQVQFQSANGTIVAADIGKDGKYTATGVPIGTAKIAVSYVDPKATDYFKAMSNAGRGQGGGKTSLPKGSPRQFNKIPDKHGDFAVSGLAVEVQTGPNSHDIDLK
jgi:hypothetical protein